MQVQLSRNDLRCAKPPHCSKSNRRRSCRLQSSAVAIATTCIDIVLRLPVRPFPCLLVMPCIFSSFHVPCQWLHYIAVIEGPSIPAAWQLPGCGLAAPCTNVAQGRACMHCTRCAVYLCQTQPRNQSSLPPMNARRCRHNSSDEWPLDTQQQTLLTGRSAVPPQTLHDQGMRMCVPSGAVAGCY